MKNKKLIILITVIVITILTAIIVSYNNNKGTLIGLSYNEVKEKVKSKESFILIVSQTTCSHCANYKPKIKNIAKKYNITVYYIDYDQEKNYENFLKEFNLDGSTPTTLFFKDGKETSVLNRLEGGNILPSKIVRSFKKMGFIK